MEDNYNFLGRCFPPNLDDNKERLPFFLLFLPKGFHCLLPKRRLCYACFLQQCRFRCHPLYFLVFLGNNKKMLKRLQERQQNRLLSPNRLRYLWLRSVAHPGLCMLNTNDYSISSSQQLHWTTRICVDNYNSDCQSSTLKADTSPPMARDRGAH